MTRSKDPQADRPHRVTAKMVAEKAGVSRSAVSRAFTDGGRVDAAKRQRIHEVADQLGYQPNALAAGLQGGRSHLVAIFVGNMRSHYDTDFVSHLVRALNGLDKWPILIDGGGEQAQTAISKVLRYPLDALIVRGGSMSADVVSQCARLNVPMISSGRPVQARGVDNVCCRNADGSFAAAALLARKGRRRFGFLAGPADFNSSSGRRDGALRALGEAGLPLLAEREGDYTVDGGYRAAMDMLQEVRLDALICANDAMAIGALGAARELGIAVPGALSVVGFDDVAMAGWPVFNLTTVRNPITASTDEIVALLARRLEDPAKPDETVFVTPELVLRGTH